ncbi:MAG: hypothetical protein ACE5FF_09265 [Saprospiraceae bacterium]
MKIQFFTLLVILGLASLLASCSTGMLLNDNLKKDTTVMDVKGRSGGMPGQKLVFGDYFSSKVDRRVVEKEGKAYALSVEATLDTMQFEMFDSVGHSSRIFCLNKRSQIDVPVVGEKYSVPVGDQNACFGTIALDSNAPAWDFSIQNPSSIAPGLFAGGTITNGTISIDIKEVRQNAKGRRMSDHVLGFEFWQGNTVIGAVELVGGGKIMIKNSLSDDIKFLIATTAATMLFRYDMSKAKEN